MNKGVRNKGVRSLYYFQKSWRGNASSRREDGEVSKNVKRRAFDIFKRNLGIGCPSLEVFG